jgi:addiction module RelB/DinJ family antitoxin
MSATRSVMLHARVYPEIKHASERVLARIGLNMSQAVELFLRRMILDQKLPFDVVALDDVALEKITEQWGQTKQSRTPKAKMRTSRPPR